MLIELEIRRIFNKYLGHKMGKTRWLFDAGSRRSNSSVLMSRFLAWVDPGTTIWDREEISFQTHSVRIPEGLEPWAGSPGITTFMYQEEIHVSSQAAGKISQVIITTTKSATPPQPRLPNALPLRGALILGITSRKAYLLHPSSKYL